MDAPDAVPAAAQRTDHWIQVLCALNRQVRHWQAALDQALQSSAAASQPLESVELLVLWIARQSAAPGISQVDIARNLAVSAAQVCAVVESLQQQGWLQTLRRPDDRRRHCCSLTPAGEALLTQLLEQLGPTAEQCLADEPAPPLSGVPSLSLRAATGDRPFASIPSARPTRSVKEKAA
jgi:DNA-binding MarR family transcriptional regulator